MNGLVLLTSVCTAVAAYLLVGFLTGNGPRLERDRPRRRDVSDQQLWLIQAGTDLTPRQFWAGSVTVAAATFLVVTVATATPVVALVPAVAVGVLPRAYFARSRIRRLREVQESWPDGLRDLLSSIAAGMSLNQAVLGLALTGPAPLQSAFARYPALARMLGVIPALEVIKEELADPTSDRIIEVLILAHEKGGHILSTILRDLADATVRDVRTLEEIATEQLEQKINARAVFVLPWTVLLLLTLRPGHFRDFYQSGAGLLVVTIGGILSLVGMVVVTRLAREPAEQRVLGASATVTRREGEWS